jgi:hypothetical protein
MEHERTCKETILGDIAFPITKESSFRRWRSTMDVAAINSSKCILKIWPKFWIMADVVWNWEVVHALYKKEGNRK